MSFQLPTDTWDDLVEILAQPDMINVMKESSKAAVDAAESETTPPFDGKIQANPQEIATPVDELTSSELEAPEFFESISQHIAIGTSDSEFHSELPRSSCLEVSSVLPQQVVLEHMLPLPSADFNRS